MPHRADIDPITRLYISRSKVARRQILNEEEVFNCLSEFGFTRIYLEDYNLATQISLLSNAEIIVAPHGAGLTNLVWCNSTARVLEIFSPNYINICFWAIANQIGMEYFYLIGDNEKAPDYLSRSNFNKEDIFVPIKRLYLSLNMLLNDTNNS